MRAEPPDRVAVAAAVASVAVLAAAGGPVGWVIGVVLAPTLLRAPPASRFALAGVASLLLAAVAAFAAAPAMLGPALLLALLLHLYAARRRAAREARPLGPLALASFLLLCSLALGAILFVVFPRGLLAAPRGGARAAEDPAAAPSPEADLRRLDPRLAPGPDGKEARGVPGASSRAAGGSAGNGPGTGGGARSPSNRGPSSGDRGLLGMGVRGEGDDLGEGGGSLYLDPAGQRRLFRRAAQGALSIGTSLARAAQEPAVWGLLVALLASAAILRWMLPEALRRRLRRALSPRGPGSRVDFWDDFLALCDRRGIARPPGGTGRALAAVAARTLPVKEVATVLEAFYRSAYGEAALSVAERRRALEAVQALERYEPPAAEQEGGAP